MPTFRLGPSTAEFAHTALQFVKEASADGKQKTIIDLSGNGGGDVVQGFNLFRIFFPDRPIHSATRFRKTEIIDLMGKVYSHLSKYNSIDPPIDSKNAVTASQHDGFMDWRQLFGSNTGTSSDMSALYAIFNLSMVSTRENPINGYGDVPLDPSKQLFTPENIILVS